MDLHQVLEEARALGFLGPGDVDAHIEHAQAMLDALQTAGCDGAVRLLDLGSGGGLPGLFLAGALPEATIVLLDGSQRRTDFLDRAVRRLSLNRCTVVAARAEEAGRAPEMRRTFDVVVARSFGAPAVVAECAAPLLRLGGRLMVSEPPEATGDRWPAAGLDLLGQRFESLLGTVPAFAVIHQAEVCPDRFPRRVGMAARRPLF